VARRLTAALVVTIVVAACIDRGPPSTEEQMRSMGLPLDILVTIDERSEVTIRSNDGTPELLFFTADVFGGSRLGVVPAERPTTNGGMVGDAGTEYLFGAGQGPIARVETDESEARVELVNPDIDGWLIVVPETVGTAALPWRLIGPDGVALYASVGIGMPDWGLAVDDATQAYVSIRDGVPELLVYTPNAFGGADLAVTAADTPTVNGGRAGTATSPGYRYLFGAGQGTLKPYGVDAGVIRTADQTPVSPMTRSTKIVIDAERQTFDATWIVVVPDSVPIDNVEWRLTGPDGTVIYRATGLSPVP
jgi:hypothetical protein